LRNLKVMVTSKRTLVEVQSALDAKTTSGYSIIFAQHHHYSNLSVI
jgi:hypothetical protein